MNEDRMKGAAREMRGSIKETTGKLTGNSKLEAKGAAQKVGGRALNAVGKMEDKVKQEARKH